MKIHTSLRKVLAAAKRDKHTGAFASPKKREQLERAIKDVETFVLDAHEYIQFYGEDAGMK